MVASLCCVGTPFPVCARIVTAKTMLVKTRRIFFIFLVSSWEKALLIKSGEQIQAKKRFLRESNHTAPWRVQEKRTDSRPRLTPFSIIDLRFSIPNDDERQFAREVNPGTVPRFTSPVSL